MAAEDKPNFSKGNHVDKANRRRGVHHGGHRQEVAHSTYTPNIIVLHFALVEKQSTSPFDSLG